MANVTFDGVTVSGDLPTADLMAMAVHQAIMDRFTTFDGGQFTTPDLDTVRTWAIGFVNDYAGELRTQIGTDIPFQGDVYQLKEREVAGYLSDADPTAQKYPVLFAEAQARGMEVAAVAAEYAYNAQAWPVAIAQIEALRMGAITAISAATTIEEIEAVLAGVANA